KTKSLEELSLLDEYIYGYLINPSSNIDIQLNNNISFNDLLIIDSLMDIWETVIFRSPLYSNYNLTIYTRKNDNDYIKKRLHSYSELMTVKIEYI
ncbi:MAG: hypothetical protein N4A50_01455, partial [Vallitalea sp.]|nr:hypothetical protein [Vallitalea sp.]